MTLKSPRSRRRKPIQKKTRVSPFKSIQTKIVSGLTIRKYLTKSKEFQERYSAYHIHFDYSKRAAFLLAGPIEILESLDEDLVYYLKHVTVFREYMYIIIPIIEEAYRYYIVTCSGETLPQANLNEESFIVSDEFGYYDSLALYLRFKEDKELFQIKKICGTERDFFSQFTQIVSKLRTACLDLNPDVEHLNSQRYQGG